MSNSENILDQEKTSTWRKSDTTWTLGLFGTAIGAGVLFFPIRAGYGGLIPILIMLVLAWPIAFYCHRALARLCLSGSSGIAVQNKTFAEIRSQKAESDQLRRRLGPQQVTAGDRGGEGFGHAILLP